MREVSIWLPEDMDGKRPFVVASGQMEYDSLTELANECLPYGISTATYKDGHRSADCVIGQQFAAYDIDCGIPLASVLPNLLAYRHFVLASMNHMKDKGDGNGVRERYHIFVELSESITDKGLYRYIFNEFASETFGNVYDQGVCDICRFFAPHKAVLSAQEHGEQIDVDKYRVGYEFKRKVDERMRPRKEAAAKNRMLLRFGKLTTLDQVRQTNYFKALEQTFSQVNERYYTMRKLVWFMKKNDFSRSDTVQLVTECFPTIEGRDWTQLAEKWYDWLI